MPTLTKEIVISKTFAELDWQNMKGESTYTVDPVTESVTITSTETNQPGYGFIKVPNLADGAIIEVTCEAKQGTEANSQGRIAMDFYDSNNNKTTAYIQPDSTEWTPYNFIQIVPRNTSSVLITFGLWTTLTGSISFRNIRIKIYNGKPDVKTQPQLNYRIATIKHTDADGWVIDNAPGRFPCYGVTSLEVGTAEIIVYFEPFGTAKSHIVLQEDYFGVGVNYHLRSAYADGDSAIVRIYNAVDNTLVNPQTLSGNMYFGFMAYTIEGQT